MAAILALGLVSTRAVAATPEEALPSYDLDARVDVAARTVRGHARIVVPNTTAVALAELWLWQYPERFATRSAALNDFDFYWIYPARFNPGSMRIDAVRVDGAAALTELRDHVRAGPRTLVRVVLPRALAPGASATLDVDFVTTAPRRYGGFGCYDGTCTLEGFYPMVAPPGSSGAPILDAMPGRGRYALTLAVAEVSDVVINGRLSALARGFRRRYDVGVVLGCTLVVGRPRLRAYERVVRGVRVVVLSPQSRGVPSPASFTVPYRPADRVGRVLDTAAEAIDLLAEIGAPMPAGEDLDLVEGALRIELAQPLAGMILVSDHVFDIFPLQRFLKFHELELVRAIFEHYLTRRMAARERPDDLAWSAGVGASYLVDLFTLRAYRKAEFARQILSWVAFIPAIDRILYAPQIPFASSYFYTLEDPDPLRDRLAQFNHARPTGKTLYSKLRDLMGQVALDQITRALLVGAPLRTTAEAMRGATLDWFWAEWLGPYPAVDYRFADVRSQKLAPDRWLHTARVVKRGLRPPTEPVEVRAVDKRGQTQTLTWDGVGQEHEYRFLMAAPLSVIEIDPRGRLVEELPGSNDDLRFDNRQPARWKFIYNNFGGLLRFFPTLGLDLSLDFSLARILDLKNAMRFVVYRTDSTQIGLSASYTRAFGHKVTAARLANALTVSLGAARIDPSFARAVGAQARPGTQVSSSLGWSYDDRLFVWEPRRALSLDAGIAAITTVLDDGSVLAQGTLSAGWESIVPLADGHGLAMSLGGAVTFGDLRIARQMLSGGGGGGLRGYDIEELLGRWRTVGRIEYRHVFVHDLNISLLETLYLRGIGGGLFAEVGVVSPCSSYVPDTKSIAADVGYSIRIFGDWFGVSQTTLNLDFAVPLVRHDRDCFGQLASAATRVPFGFFFSFAPPW